jgi:hypothetical protein
VVGVAQEKIQKQRTSGFFEEFFAEPDDAGAGIENDPVLSSNHLDTRSIAAVFQRTPMRDCITASHSPEPKGEIASRHLGLAPAAVLIVCRYH